MTNTRNLYKKSTVILMNMARDLFLSEVGQQVPTIQEYTDTFHVSRGIVQKAMDLTRSPAKVTTRLIRAEANIE